MCHHIVYCQKWLYKNLSLKILYDGTSPISIENEKSFIMVQYGDYSHTSSIIIITNYYFMMWNTIFCFSLWLQRITSWILFAHSKTEPSIKDTLKIEPFIKVHSKTERTIKKKNFIYIVIFKEFNPEKMILRKL